MELNRVFFALPSFALDVPGIKQRFGNRLSLVERLHVVSSNVEPMV